MSNLKSTIHDLKNLSNATNLAGMSNFGINTENAFGISIPNLRKLAKEIGLNTDLAVELWDTEYHEARILASMVADPRIIDSRVLEIWVEDINSWDLCDQCCNNLIGKTEFAVDFTFKWTERKEEFVKRAGFVLIAVLSVHKKTMSDKDFQKYLPTIIKHATDGRNFVMKAVNWSLRQIGKRNLFLNTKAVETAKTISKIDSKSAKWIAANALNEIQSDKVIKRLHQNMNK